MTEREVMTLARRLDHLLRVERMPTDARGIRWRESATSAVVPAITRTATWRRLVELGAGAVPALDRALLVLGAPAAPELLHAAMAERGETIPSPPRDWNAFEERLPEPGSPEPELIRSRIRRIGYLAREEGLSGSTQHRTERSWATVSQPAFLIVTSEAAARLLRNVEDPMALAYLLAAAAHPRDVAERAAVVALLRYQHPRRVAVDDPPEAVIKKMYPVVADPVYLVGVEPEIIAHLIEVGALPIGFTPPKRGEP